MEWKETKKMPSISAILVSNFGISGLCDCSPAANYKLCRVFAELLTTVPGMTNNPTLGEKKKVEIPAIIEVNISSIKIFRLHHRV